MNRKSDLMNKSLIIGVVILFIGAASIATIVRAIFLKETLEPQERDQRTSTSETINSLWETFRRQPRTIYAMMVISIISGFAMRLTWTFLTPYATYEIRAGRFFRNKAMCSRLLRDKHILFVVILCQNQNLCLGAFPRYSFCRF